jgi:hypothetical protein
MLTTKMIGNKIAEARKKINISHAQKKVQVKDFKPRSGDR